MQNIPKLANDGFLPPGEWPCSPEEAIGQFGKQLGSQEPNYTRFALGQALEGLFRFGRSLGASRAILGGSFVSTRPEPRDVDVVLVFPESNQIPDQAERLDLQGGRLDVFYASEDSPEVLGALVHLLTHNRKGRSVGILDVLLQDHPGTYTPLAYREPSEELRSSIAESYYNRHVVTVRPNKVLVTVHGIRSQGEWSAEVCHIASSRGWIVAPFYYDRVDADIFLDERRRQKIIQAFRAFIDDMDTRYSAPISVLAHSFGTYVVAKYCTGFDAPPVTFDTLIFTGSVLSRAFDVTRFEGRVKKLLHEVAVNDTTVDWAQVATISDSDFGNAGCVGFDVKPPLLVERTADIFDHTNVIRRDVIAKRWMPWLEANAAPPRELDDPSPLFTVRAHARNDL